MEEQIILLDTSVLIDYFRKKAKSKSYFYKLTEKSSSFVVSLITHFEIYTGIVSDIQQIIWDDFFKGITVLSFDVEISIIAANMNIRLKKNRKQIDKADLFIAATAIRHKVLCATLNRKHFERIEELRLI